MNDRVKNHFQACRFREELRRQPFSLRLLSLSYVSNLLDFLRGITDLERARISKTRSQ